MLARLACEWSGRLASRNELTVCAAQRAGRVAHVRASFALKPAKQSRTTWHSFKSVPTRMLAPLKGHRGRPLVSCKNKRSLAAGCARRRRISQRQHALAKLAQLARLSGRVCVRRWHSAQANANYCLPPRLGGGAGAAQG